MYLQIQDKGEAFFSDGCSSEAFSFWHTRLNDDDLCYVLADKNTAELIATMEARIEELREQLIDAHRKLSAWERAQ
jgi:hypothetical protein